MTVRVSMRKCVYGYVRVHVCVHVCAYEYMCVSTEHMHVREYVCVRVSMYVWDAEYMCVHVNV